VSLRPEQTAPGVTDVEKPWLALDHRSPWLVSDGLASSRTCDENSRKENLIGLFARKVHSPALGIVFVSRGCCFCLQLSTERLLVADHVAGGMLGLTVDYNMEASCNHEYEWSARLRKKHSVRAKLHLRRGTSAHCHGGLWRKRA